MNSAKKIANELHRQALAVVSRYKRSEVDLLEILQRVDESKAFRTLGYSSLFRYACDGLGLSEDVAYIFINVARKARLVPALKAEIKSGSITVSKAKKITSVINRDNQNQWLELAKSASKAQLEKAVAQAAPEKTVYDKLKYVGSDRVQLQVGVSEQLMLKIRRAQDVLSQKKRAPVSLEAVMEMVFAQYLEREDPLRKAERQKVKGKLVDDLRQGQPADVPLARVVESLPGKGDGAKPLNDVVGTSTARQVPGPAKKREPIPARLKHRLMLKFKGQCAYDQNGSRCEERRFLEFHHIQPVSRGGRNEFNNLKLLCNGHHRAVHDR